MFHAEVGFNSRSAGKIHYYYRGDIIMSANVSIPAVRVRYIGSTQNVEFSLRPVSIPAVRVRYIKVIQPL